MNYHKLEHKLQKKCKGLPLSIVLVAGVLAKTEKTKYRWTQILESLPSCILGGANEHGKGIIEMSYRHLPDYMKPCFLYFGHFLRDREVPVSKIIRMLIAEGIVRHSELKSLENMAEDCLMDLISRSLVTVSHEKSNGGVKSCRLHDLIHEFCLRKAKEEKFMQQIHGYSHHFPSSDNYEDYGMDPSYDSSSTPIKYDLRHICIYSKRNHFIMLKPSGPEVRSLSFLPASDTNPNYPYDISFISHNFKILTNLNLEDINIGESFNAIMVLVHLKYLAVQGYIDCIPSSIANIWKLETFVVKNLSAKAVEVPDAICDMVKLRHVHISGSASFKLDLSRSKKSSILDNLQTLSTPFITHGGDMDKILRRVKGIKKLKCIFLDSSDDNKNCNKFPEMDFLSQLVSLKLSYGGIGRSLCEFNFPPNLTKLTLLNFRKPWSEITLLARLNNLEVLKLLSNAFAGESWIMEDEVFSKLKFLKLDTLDIKEWIAKGENFPQLEHLILNQCEKLENIPSRVGDITTLEMIEVIWCNESVAVSAREIEEEQMDFSHVVKINVH